MNNRKMVLQLVCLIACGSILLASFTTPAHAAFGAIDPSNYITNITTDGDTKTVVYQFSGFNPYCIDTRNGEVYSQGIVTGSKTVSTEGQVPISLRFYPFGKKFYINQPIYNGTAIDVRDILPGATLNLTFSFLTTFAQITNIDGVSVTYDATAACYDSAGNYIRQTTISKTTTDITIDGSKTTGMALELTIAPDVSYVALYSTYTLKTTGLDFVCNVTPLPIQLSVPINMIYENSQTMNEIKEELGELNSGGEAGEQLGGAADELDKDNDELGGALDDYNNAESNLPTTPSNFDEVIDEEAMDEAIENASLVFDWNASGLFNMFTPMGLSCGLSVLFYVIFGKKG